MWIHKYEMGIAMSVDGDVLGVGIIGGGGAAGAASLATTGNPILIGALAGVAIVVILGLITRFSQNR